MNLSRVNRISRLTRVLAKEDIKLNENGFNEDQNLSKSDMVKIIEENNPVYNDYATWVRTEDDIQNVTEIFGDQFEGMYPDFTKEMAEEALKTGKVMVYSSKPFSLGSFVTPSKMYAESYSGDGKIYKGLMSLENIAWIDEGEGQICRLDT